MRIVIHAVIWVFPLAVSRGMQFVLGRLPIGLGSSWLSLGMFRAQMSGFGLGCTATTAFPPVPRP
jgi:hypothetical protein